MLQKIVRRIAGVSPAFQDRGRLACISGSRASRLHAVILNRQRARLTSNSFFVCLTANCSRNSCVPPLFFVTKNSPVYPSKVAKT
ncbi:MAG: hypothetical protein LBP59_14250 [Planctomycetaceae bacterium]|nr:hypothetical protein [Planctomycetaceae bacterium]